MRWSETVDGRRVQRSRTVHGSRADAIDELASIRLSSSRHAPSEGLTLRTFWREYAEATAQRVRPSTMRGYEGDWRYVVEPIFGDLDMSTATAREIERGLWTIEKPGTQRNAYKLLRQMFNRAYNWELIDRNPMTRRIDLRSHRREMPNAYSVDEMPAVLESWRGADWEAAAIMSMCAGLRREEAYALSWEDFSWHSDHCTAYVHQAITESGRGAHLDATKTARSERTVAVFGPPFERLRRLRGSGPLVPGEVHGFDHPRNVAERYRKWMHRKELAHIRWVPWKNLRHSYATALRAAGVDAASISATLGHADISTAYRHYMAKDDSVPIAAAIAMSELVTETSENVSQRDANAV